MPEAVEHTRNTSTQEKEAKKGKRQARSKVPRLSLSQKSKIKLN